MSFILGILAIVGGLTAIGVLGSLGNAYAQRIKTSPVDTERLTRRMDEMEQRLLEAETALRELAPDYDRLVDLEERIEFSERLLQQLRSRDQLPPPADGGEPG